MPLPLSEVKARFDNIKELPTLPSIAVRLLELLKDDNATLREITDLISVDPALATSVLRVANSVLYALPSRVDSLRRAFVILGTNEISNIILSVSFSKVFKLEKSNKYFNMKKFWEHSVITGYIARLVAREIGMRTHGEEYTAGLIHDIGKLVLANYFPDEFAQVIKIMAAERIPNYIAEKMVLGVSHMQMGALLAKKWNLPDNLVECIVYHHKPEFAEKYPEIVSLVTIGDYFANRLRINPTILGRTHSSASQALYVLRQKSRGFNLYKFRRSLKDEIPKARQFMAMFLRGMKV